MLTARQAQFISSSAGHQLPNVWDALDRKGTKFIRGQLALVVAAPGVGKSAFMLSYAVKSRASTLYFSADSDQFVQNSRMLSIEHGWPLSKAGEFVRDQRITDELDDIQIEWNFDASPTLSLIEKSLTAYDEKFGDYPELILVDNVTNILTKASEEDPFAGLEALMDFLHELARDTGSCVVGLHHVTGEYNNGDRPIPLGGIKGQIGRVPELILSLHRTDSFGSATMRVSTVKNRAGRADPSGADWAELRWVGDRMLLEDLS